MSEVLLALKAIPQLVIVINNLVEEVKLLRREAINKAVDERIGTIKEEFHKIKQVKTDEEFKSQFNSLYDSIFK